MWAAPVGRQTTLRHYGGTGGEVCRFRLHPTVCGWLFVESVRDRDDAPDGVELHVVSGSPADASPLPLGAVQRPRRAGAPPAVTPPPPAPRRRRRRRPRA